MHPSKILLTALALLLAAEIVFAQRPGKSTRSRYHYSNPKVRGNKARIICPVFDKSRYPLHSLGFKLGDPFAITYKYYPNKKFAFAADFGKAASGLYNQYFRDKFNSYVNADTFPPGESDIVYVAHHVRSDLVGEVKVLYYLDGQKISDGLRGYAGLGWQWKSTHLRYDYQYSSEAGGTQDPFGSFERRRQTMGPQIVAGMEYAYFSIPISAFMEVEYFFDVQADFGWAKFEGGVGLRYVFN